MIQQTNLINESSRAVACALVACTRATPLAATASDGAESSWQFEATPCLRATGLDGTVAINNRPQSGIAVQLNFSDLFKILDFAAVGSFEAKNRPWGVLLDAAYLKVSDAPQGFSMLSANHYRA